MTVRKKLTDAQVTFAFIIGGGLVLAILGYALSAAQASLPNLDLSWLNVMLVGGVLIAILGTAAWMVVTRPWKDFDDWSVPLYTGHTDHGHAASPVHDPHKPDDLTTIPGINEKTVKVLNSIGISTFAELAAYQPADLERIVRDAGLRATKVSSWIEQAKAAASGNSASSSSH